MQELSERFEEQQKSLSAFNAKNADSIVFTPYHMVDYFASQGIKLVLEDNPPDQFGKQLKSFTNTGHTCNCKITLARGTLVAIVKRAQNGLILAAIKTTELKGAADVEAGFV